MMESYFCLHQRKNHFTFLYGCFDDYASMSLETVFLLKSIK